MRRNIRHAITVFAAVAFIGLPQTADAQSYNFPGTGEGIIGYVGSITATGGDVFLKYLGFEAQYTDALYWSADAGTTWSFLFNNKDDVQGDEFSFGPIAAGTDLIFKLYLDNSGTGSWIDPLDANQSYYAGGGFTNPDGEQHAKFATYTSQPGDAATYNYQIGFEDRHADGSPGPDWDHDDLVFAIAGATIAVPEPASMALLGMGLFGVFGVAFRRREQDDQEA